MFRNAVHNALLNPLTMGTTFPCVLPRNDHSTTDLVSGVGVAERITAPVAVPRVDEDVVLSAGPVLDVQRSLAAGRQRVVPRLDVDAELGRSSNYVTDEAML